jgi:hypothetical protein
MLFYINYLPAFNYKKIKHYQYYNNQVYNYITTRVHYINAKKYVPSQQEA